MAAVALALAAARPASADPGAERRAEALFREGRTLLERGDVPRGCAKLAASLELVRRASTVLNLADCDERQGHLVASVGRWQQGIAMLPASDVRVAVARERLASVRKRIPRVSVRVVGAVPPDAVAELDGMPVARAEIEGDHQLDPGPHELVVTTAARAEVRRAFRLEEAERQVLTLDLGEAPAPIAPAPPRAGGGLRTAGYVIGGVGLASLAVGGVTGALTIDKKRVMEENCATACNDAAREAATAGKALSAASTVTFVVGGALAVTGLVMVLVGGAKPNAPSAALALVPGPGGGGAAITGVF